MTKKTLLHRRRETDLVVEGDADVRAFTIETVRELGYDVPEARGGISALNGQDSSRHGH